jgi:hypothetical protein
MGLSQDQLNKLFLKGPGDTLAVVKGYQDRAHEAQQAQLGRDAALSNLVTGKGLDQQNESSKLDHQAQISRDEFNTVQDAANAAPGQHITAKMGNASYGEAVVDPSVRAGKVSGQEATALKKLADGTIGKVAGKTAALESLTNAVNNPSSVNDNLIQVGLARLAEGPGQRLLHTIVDKSGITSTGAGDLVDVQNFLRGGGMSKMQPGQKQAILDAISQHKDLANQEFNDASSVYHGQAPLIASHLSPETHAAMYDSYAKPFQGAISRLTPAPAAPIDPRVSGQVTPPAPRAAGIVDKLADWIKGSPAQQAAPQAGAQAPMSFEDWKARKATGQ